MRNFLLSLLFAAGAFAQPVITSVTPATGDVAGNTLLTIHGSGFLAGAKVFVRDAEAWGVTLVDANTLTARTPIGLPGPAAVMVSQPTGNTSANGFTYTGDPLTAFDRMLIPILTGPIHGAYGSEFHTELEAWNPGFFAAPVNIYGLQWTCMILCPPLDPLGSPLRLEAGKSLSDSQPFDLSGNPGRFIYVPKSETASLGTFLRVYDVTREASNYGTELRVVHADEFVNDRVFSFPSIPTDPRFRITLRVYGAPGAAAVALSINDGNPIDLAMRRGADLFDPSYAEFSDFPVGVGPIDIVVIPPLPPGGVSPRIYFPPEWAFLTVTNNDTQQITTVTPN